MQLDSILRSEALRKGTGQHKIVCPSCGPERKKKNDRTLSLNITQDKVLYQCWHCQQQGIVPLEERMPNIRHQERKVVAQKIQTEALTAESLSFLKERG